MNILKLGKLFIITSNPVWEETYLHNVHVLWVPAGFSVPWFYLKIPGVILYTQHLCLLSSCHTAVLDGFNYCSVSFFLMYFPYVSFSIGRLFTPFFIMFSPFLSIPHHRPSHHPRPSRSSPGSQQLPSIARPAPALPPWGPLR